MTHPILPGVCHAYGCDNAAAGDDHYCPFHFDQLIAAQQVEADAWYAAHHLDGAA